MNEGDVEYLLKIRDEFSVVLDRFEAKAASSERQSHALGKGAEHAGEGFSHMKEMVKGAIEVFALYEAYDFGKESFQDFAKLETVTAGIDQILKNTHESAGQTSESLKELAEHQKDLTIFSTRQTLESEKMLLAFTNIRGEIYDHSIPAIANMASFMGTDLKTATEIAGKALNNPRMAARLLRQEGIALSKQQIKLIAHLQDTGHMAQAQGLILSELEKRYAGAGEVAAKTGEGPMKQLSNSFEEIREMIGALISQGLKKLIPYIKELVKYVKEHIPQLKEWAHEVMEIVRWLKKNWEIIKLIAEVLGPAIIAYKAFIGILEGAKIAQIALNVAMEANPIGLAIAGVTALGIAWYKVTELQEKYNSLQEEKFQKETSQNEAEHILSLFKDPKNKGKDKRSILKKELEDLQRTRENLVLTGDGGEDGFETIKEIDVRIKELAKRTKELLPEKSTLGGASEKPEKPGKKGKKSEWEDYKITNDIGSSAVKEQKNTQINITLGALNQGGITIHSNTVKEGAAEIERVLMEYMTSLINNSQIIAGN